MLSNRHCRSSALSSILLLSIPLPLPLPTTAADLPPGHATPGCAARSEAAPVLFTLRDLRFAVSGPTETARLRFDVTNAATGYTSRCAVEGPELLAPPPPPSEVNEVRRRDKKVVKKKRRDEEELWLPCGDISEEAEGGRGQYCDLDTWVLFRRYTGEGKDQARLVVNQTWYCDDVSPEYPISFTGTADAKLASFACTSSGPGAEECTAPDSTLDVWQWGRDDLPPYALECSLNGTQKKLKRG